MDRGVLRISSPFWFIVEPTGHIQVGLNSAVCTAPHHGILTLKAAVELHEKLSEAISAARDRVLDRNGLPPGGAS